MTTDDLVAMSTLNAEAPVWRYQYCDWSVRPTQSTPPLSQLLKRAQNSTWEPQEATDTNGAHLDKDNRSQETKMKAEMSPDSKRALSPLQAAGEQLRQQLLKVLHLNCLNKF